MVVVCAPGRTLAAVILENLRVCPLVQVNKLLILEALKSVESAYMHTPRHRRRRLFSTYGGETYTHGSNRVGQFRRKRGPCSRHRSWGIRGTRPQTKHFSPLKETLQGTRMALERQVRAKVREHEDRCASSSVGSLERCCDLDIRTVLVLDW